MKPSPSVCNEQQTHLPGTSSQKTGSLKVVATLALGALLVVVLRTITFDTPLKPGDPSPRLTLQRADTGSINLGLPRDRAVALVFLSTDCPQCKRDLVRFQALSYSFSGRIDFLLVFAGDRSTVRHYLDSTGVALAAAVDAQGRAREAFRVFKVPALFLIDTHGTIRNVVFGESTIDARRRQMDALLNRDEVVLQDRTNDCGVAAFRMILAGFGRDAARADLEDRLELSTKGTSLRKLKEVAEEFGLQAEGIRVPLHELKNITYPAILYLKNAHYVVADSLDAAGTLTLRDPGRGRVKMSRESLEKIWNGEALIFHE